MDLKDIGGQFEPVEVCGEDKWIRCPISRADLQPLVDEQEVHKNADKADAAEALTRVVASSLVTCLRDVEGQEEPSLTVDQAIVVMRKESILAGIKSDFESPVVVKCMELCGLQDTAQSLGKVLKLAREKEKEKHAPSSATSK